MELSYETICDKSKNKRNQLEKEHNIPLIKIFDYLKYLLPIFRNINYHLHISNPKHISY